MNANVNLFPIKFSFDVTFWSERSNFIASPFDYSIHESLVTKVFLAVNAIWHMSNQVAFNGTVFFFFLFY